MRELINGPRNTPDCGVLNGFARDPKKVSKELTLEEILNKTRKALLAGIDLDKPQSFSMESQSIKLTKENVCLLKKHTKNIVEEFDMKRLKTLNTEKYNDLVNGLDEYALGESDEIYIVNKLSIRHKNKGTRILGIWKDEGVSIFLRLSVIENQLELSVFKFKR